MFKIKERIHLLPAHVWQQVFPNVTDWLLQNVTGSLPFEVMTWTAALQVMIGDGKENNPPTSLPGYLN